MHSFRTSASVSLAAQHTFASTTAVRHLLFRGVGSAAAAAAAAPRVPPPPPLPAAARSLAEAWPLQQALTRLDLRTSPDLACRNVMCGGAGGPCVCRLAAALAWLPALRVLDVSGNRLPSLPDAVWAGAALEELAAADNRIAHIGAAAGGAAARLARLDLSRNALAGAAAFAAWLPRLAALCSLRIVGNPVCGDARELAAVRALLPRGCLLDVG